MYSCLLGTWSEFACFVGISSFCEIGADRRRIRFVPSDCSVGFVGREKQLISELIAQNDNSVYSANPTVHMYTLCEKSVCQFEPKPGGSQQIPSFKRFRKRRGIKGNKLLLSSASYSFRMAHWPLRPSELWRLVFWYSFTNFSNEFVVSAFFKTESLRVVLQAWQPCPAPRGWRGIMGVGVNPEAIYNLILICVIPGVCN